MIGIWEKRKMKYNSKKQNNWNAKTICPNDRIDVSDNFDLVEFEEE
jgi:hypothetical protein